MDTEALCHSDSLFKQTIIDCDYPSKCSDSLDSSVHTRIVAWIANSLADAKPEDHIHDMHLTGMEQAMSPREITSSRSPRNYKPLPPPPSRGRRISLSSPIIPEQSRRSSSVYSQSTAWYSLAQAPSGKDILDEHPVPRVNSIFYSNSTIAASATMSEPQLLLPRTYNPQYKTSSRQSPASSTSRQRQPSALLPPLPVRTKNHDKHVRTISLEQAKAALEAPGKEHLLPEELRARTRIKSRSSIMLNDLASQEVEKPHKPGSTFKTGNQNIVRLPTMLILDPDAWPGVVPELKKALPAHTHTDSFISGTTAVISSRDHSANVSETTSDTDYAAVFDQEPERGRTLQRVPRNSVKLQIQRNTDSMAAEYASLLDQPWHEDRSVVEEPDNVSWQEVAPKPLFSKPLYEFGSDSEYSQSPLRSEIRRRLVQEDEEDSDSGTPPPDSFWHPEPDESEQTGIIPISPPPPLPDLAATPLPSPKIKAERLMPQRKKVRESAYYPYVGKRRYHAKTQHSPLKSDHIKHPSPKIGQVKHRSSLAMHAARVAAKTTIIPGPRKKPAELPELFSKATQKAANLVDKLIQSKHEYPPTSPPNLDQSVTGVYLGWSEESKEDFDASKPVSPKLHYAIGKYGPRPVVKPAFSHTQTPARPLDERPLALIEESERLTHSRKGSFFGSLLEFAKDSTTKEEKRRHDIKQSIRLLPTQTTSNDHEERPQIVKNSFSEPDVPIAPLQANAPANNAIWGRRVSEFGVL